MTAMNLPELFMTPVSVLSQLAPWFFFGGAALAGLALVWRQLQDRRRHHSQVRLGQFIGNTLSQMGTWGGVQFLWLPASRQQLALQKIESDADSPEVMLHMLAMEEGSLAGQTHLTALCKQDATDWVQQTLYELGQSQVPIDGGGARRQLCALVFVGSLPPVELHSLTVLTDYLRDCAAVGLVSCTPLQVAQVSLPARVASAGLLTVGLLGVLVPAALSLVGQNRATGVACPSPAPLPEVTHPTTGEAGERMPATLPATTRPVIPGVSTDAAAATSGPPVKPEVLRPDANKTLAAAGGAADSDHGAVENKNPKTKPPKTEKTEKTEKPPRHERTSVPPKKDTLQSPSAGPLGAGAPLAEPKQNKTATPTPRPGVTEMTGALSQPPPSINAAKP